MNEFKLNTISTGDILRDNINRGTDIGKQAQAIMLRGGEDLLLKRRSFSVSHKKAYSHKSHRIGPRTYCHASFS